MEVNMCVPYPKVQAPPPPDPSIAMAQKEARDDAQSVRSDRKAEVLEKGVRRARGGGGRRSLLTGSKGGMGYYNEYL